MLKYTNISELQTNRNHHKRSAQAIHERVSVDFGNPCRGIEQDKLQEVYLESVPSNDLDKTRKTFLFHHPTTGILQENEYACRIQHRRNIFVSLERPDNMQRKANQTCDMD